MFLGTRTLTIRLTGSKPMLFCRKYSHSTVLPSY